MWDNISEINILSVILGAVAYFMLGALWFTPLLGKQYDEATGVPRVKNKKWPAVYYYGPFIGALATALASAILMSVLGVESLADAILFAVIVGSGYSAAVTFTNAIAPNMPKPLLFASVVGSYHLTGSVLVALIIYWL